MPPRIRVSGPECSICCNDPDVQDAEKWVALIPCGMFGFDRHSGPVRTWLTRPSTFAFVTEHCYHKYCLDTWIHASNQRAADVIGEHAIDTMALLKTLSYTCPICRFHIPARSTRSRLMAQRPASEEEILNTAKGYVAIRLATEEDSEEHHDSPHSSEGPTNTVKNVTTELKDLQEELDYLKCCKQISEDTHMELIAFRDDQIRLLKNQLSTCARENEALRKLQSISHETTGPQYTSAALLLRSRSGTPHRWTIPEVPSTQVQTTQTSSAAERLLGPPLAKRQRVIKSTHTSSDGLDTPNSSTSPPPTARDRPSFCFHFQELSNHEGRSHTCFETEEVTGVLVNDKFIFKAAKGKGRAVQF